MNELRQHNKEHVVVPFKILRTRPVQYACDPEPADIQLQGGNIGGRLAAKPDVGFSVQKPVHQIGPEADIVVLDCVQRQRVKTSTSMRSFPN